jgi:hypothetical protein
MHALASRPSGHLIQRACAKVAADCVGTGRARRTGGDARCALVDVCVRGARRRVAGGLLRCKQDVFSLITRPDCDSGRHDESNHLLGKQSWKHGHNSSPPTRSGYPPWQAAVAVSYAYPAGQTHGVLCPTS